MTKRLILVLLLTVLAVIPTRTHAFDGDRKGFILGFGVGYGAARYSDDFSNGLATTFKIGGGPTNNYMIYYSNRVVFYGSDMAQGMSAVGVSYFLKPSGPSFFFSGEVGLANRVRVSSNTSYGTDLGITIGAGYEFTPHFMLEANVMTSDGGDVRNITLAVSWVGF